MGPEFTKPSCHMSPVYGKLERTSHCEIKVRVGEKLVIVPLFGLLYDATHSIRCGPIESPSVTPMLKAHRFVFLLDGAVYLSTRASQCPLGSEAYLELAGRSGIFAAMRKHGPKFPRGVA